MVLDVTTACEYIKKQKKILLQSDTMLSFLTPQGRIYTMLLTLQGHLGHSTLDERRGIKINEVNNKLLKYKQNENDRSKTKIFFLVVMIQSSIIKQFEQMSHP